MAACVGVPVRQRDVSAVPRIEAFRPCEPLLAFTLVRVPSGRTRPGAPALTLARLAASHVSARLVSRGAAGPKDRRDAPGAESLLSSSPSRVASHDLNRLRRARAETREDERVIAPRARRQPSRP